MGTIEEVNEIQEEEEQEDADQAGDETTKKQQFHKLLTDLKIRDNELLKENPAIRRIISGDPRKTSRCLY